MKVALFFGTFNPIHNGHLIIANSVLNDKKTNVDKVCFVVSPNSPFKDNKNLLPFNDRVELINDVIKNDDRLEVTTIEETLKEPTYTYNTISFISEHDFNGTEFCIILGADNAKTINTFYRGFDLLRNYEIIVPSRYGIDANSVFDHLCDKVPSDISIKGITSVSNYPETNISSTLIRKLVGLKKSIKYLVPECIEEKIQKLYFKEGEIFIGE